MQVLVFYHLVVLTQDLSSVYICDIFDILQLWHQLAGKCWWSGEMVWWDGQLEVHQIAQQLFNLFASSDAQLKGMDNRLGLQRKGKLES